MLLFRILIVNCTAEIIPASIQRDRQNHVSVVRYRYTWAIWREFWWDNTRATLVEHAIESCVQNHPKSRWSTQPVLFKSRLVSNSCSMRILDRMRRILFVVCSQVDLLARIYTRTAITQVSILDKPICDDISSPQSWVLLNNLHVRHHRIQKNIVLRTGTFEKSVLKVKNGEVRQPNQ